jgi:type IV pilus assembly protein PilM
LNLRRWWNRRTPHNLVGLDIDSDIVKLLKINSNEMPYKVETFALAPLPAGAIVKNEVKNEAGVSSILKDLFYQTNLSKDYIALAIPRSSVIIKNVLVDSRLNEGEIESRAWVEANRNFPDLVGDIHLDFSIVGPSAQDPSQLDLVLVVCRKEQIKPYLELLKDSNLTPKVLDVNCYALERALGVLVPDQPATEAVALLNLNFTLSTLIVSLNKQLIYAHDHSFDGQRLITQIRKHFNDKSPNLADLFQNSPSLEADPVYMEILKENLTSHLRHTMHFFYSSRPNVSISKLILAGDCAIVPSLTDFIQQQTNLPVVLADPFANMTIASSVDGDTLKKYAPALTLCCGLALSKLT